jgi:hypothetical protein
MSALPIGTDGEVLDSALSPDGRTLYIVGDFSRVGPITGCSVPVDAKTGTALPHVKINGVVTAQVRDGNGGWYVAHELTSSRGDLVSAGVAHVTAAGTADPQFSLTLGLRPKAMALSGGRLVVSGQGTDATTNGQPVVAGFDPTSGALAWWMPTNSTVFAMASRGGTVYVGGDFSRIGTADRLNLAAIDASAGTVLPWAPALGNGGSSSRVFVLAASDTAVFVGGQFQTVNGMARQVVAAVGPMNGETLGWNAQVTALQINALAVDGNTVYLGGDLTAVAGQPRVGIAAVDAVSGQPAPWSPPFIVTVAGTTVSAIAVDADTVYVGGNFQVYSSAMSESVETRLSVMAFFKSDGGIRPWFDAGPRSPVTHIDVDNGVVLLGGAFSMLGGEGRPNVAAIDVASGQLSTWPYWPSDAGYATSGAIVTHVAAGSDWVFVASSVDGVGSPRWWLGLLNAKTGVGSDMSHDFDGPVLSMAANSTTLYVGGSMQQVDPYPAPYLAAFDLAAGARLSPWAPQVNGPVTSIVATDTTVYVAGGFTAAGGQPHRGLAALDAATGKALTGWTADVDAAGGSGVVGMALDGGRLYVAGDFVSVSGTSRAGLAALDATGGALSAWGASWGVVHPRAVLAGRGKVYVAQQEGGGRPPAQAVIMFDETQGQPQQASMVAEGHILTMQMTTAGLYLGGSFNAVADDVASNLAIAS